MFASSELNRNLLCLEPAFLKSPPSMEIKPHRRFRLTWKKMSGHAAWGVPNYFISYGHCCHSVYSFSTFLEIWNAFTGTLRAPGAVRHLFEIRSFAASPPPGELARDQMGKRALVFILVNAGVFVDKLIIFWSVDECFLVGFKWM